MLSVSVYNCGFLNATQINDLGPGTIFTSPSECVASPATGEWTCQSAPVDGWAFTNTDEYNTEFSPTSFGLYEICFSEEVCEADYCYEIEITEEPTVELTVIDDLLCDGESETVYAEVEDIGGTASLNWSAPGDDDVAFNEFSFSNTTTYNASIVVTNGCGSASASVPLYSQYTPEPSLEDENLCEGGDVYLDPTSPDTPDLQFEWYFNGNLIPGEIAEEYSAVETGEFCVEVSNQCGQGEACANITIVGDIPPPLESMTIDCLGDGTAAVVPDLPDGYTVVWPDGSTDLTWEVADGSEYDGEDICMDYTDPYGCETVQNAFNVKWESCTGDVIKGIRKEYFQALKKKIAKTNLSKMFRASNYRDQLVGLSESFLSSGEFNCAINTVLVCSQRGLTWRELS